MPFVIINLVSDTAYHSPNTFTALSFVHSNRNNNLHERITFKFTIKINRTASVLRRMLALTSKGYLTEESRHSSILSSGIRATGRPLGPLASAKAKNRPSRSAQRPATNTSVIRSNSTISSQHQSRQMYKTPAVNRLQTMSAERGMAPVTPKMMPNMPVSMLRYQRMGETVISMSGSPVIAQG